MKQLLLLVLSLAVVLALAEGALRFATPHQLGFEYANGRFQVPEEYSFDPKTSPRNRLGFHEREPGRKREGVTRVLLLGDSYVDARSVSLDETVGRRLEAHLNDAGRGRFDVVSCGLPGWGQAQQLEFFERRGAELAPDLVLQLFVPLNDVRNNSKALTEAFREQVRRLVSIRPEVGRMPREQAPLFFFESSRLNQLVSHRLALFSATRGADAIPVDYRVYATESDETWAGAWRETERLLRETRRVAASLGARYALASASTPQGVLGAEEGLAVLRRAYPAMRSHEFDLDGPDRTLRRIAAEHAIPFVALEPAFRDETRAGRRLHWRFDQHWNVEGNDLAGRLLADFALAVLSGADS